MNSEVTAVAPGANRILRSTGANTCLLGTPSILAATVLVWLAWWFLWGTWTCGIVSCTILRVLHALHPAHVTNPTCLVGPQIFGAAKTIDGDPGFPPEGDSTWCTPHSSHVGGGNRHFVMGMCFGNWVLSPIPALGPHLVGRCPAHVAYTGCFFLPKQSITVVNEGVLQNPGSIHPGKTRGGTSPESTNAG